jgi:hypothetical protein
MDTRQHTEDRTPMRSLATWRRALCLALVAGVAGAQPVAERNVNVMGGPTYLRLDPEGRLVEIAGDPWRAQQVEPHCDVSARNPAVIVCSAVDYRLVDLPGGGEGVHHDSWNMIAQSTDGGTTWSSTLHPGHPLDPIPSVLGRYDFGADPMVRAGAAGLFYHAGLVADRPEGTSNPEGAIYVSTWIHLSDREDDRAPVKMVKGGLTEVVTGNAGQFRDRPHLAVGEPGGGRCLLEVEVPRFDPSEGTILETVTQDIPATPAFLAYTTFLGQDLNIRSKIHFTKTTDCGRSWTPAIKLSEGYAINQAPYIVKSPGSPRILLFWRLGERSNQPDAIMVARSDDEGKTFTKPRVLAEICPFDQPTSPYMFRSRTVPSAAADASRAYVVWSQRPRDASGQCTMGDARVVMLTTADGEETTTSGLFPVDPHGERGHQIVPTVAVSAGQVHVSWLDFRNDASEIFEAFIDEEPIVNYSGRRHTGDMRATEAGAQAVPAFPPSHQISQYVVGIPEGEEEPQPLQWNVVNARSFGRMSVPFGGDYNAIATEALVPFDPINSPGRWVANGTPGSPVLGPVFHRFWTDGRHLKLVPYEDYAHPRPHTPPDLNSALGPGGGVTLPPNSLFDPTEVRPTCDPSATGTKNLEIYTSRSTHGFYALAPWNNKALRTPQPEARSVQRAFVIVVQNTDPPPSWPDPPHKTTFRLRIQNQPPGDGVTPGRASFEQFNLDEGLGPDGQRKTVPAEPRTLQDVVLPGGSSSALSVFVTSTDNRAPVHVDVEKLDAEDNVVATRAIFLNPDPTAPENPQRPGNVDPTAEEYDIDRFEVHGLQISNVVVQDINLTTTLGAPPVRSQGPNQYTDEPGTPGWASPGWASPGWASPGWASPGWASPGWASPGWASPGWASPGWASYAVTDEEALSGYGTRQVRALYANTGNTTSTYDVRVLDTSLSEDFKYQLIVYELYTTTPTDGCDARLVPHTQVIVNIPDYDPSLERFTDPMVSQETTVAIPPGGQLYTVLVVHPRQDETGAFSNPETFAPPAVFFAGSPTAVDTADLDNLSPGDPVPPPRPVYSDLDGRSLSILATPLPDGTVGVLYASTTLVAVGGTGILVWTDDGNLPPGLSLSTDGVISGTPSTAGSFTFTAAATDQTPQTATQTFHIDVVSPLPQTFVVQNVGDSGPGTLRQAILDSNLSPARDTITFNIPGTPPYTIALSSPLPTITDPVELRGNSQHGWAGPPLIELDGSDAGLDAIGLHITGGGATVRGLIINGFDGHGILIEGAGGNEIQGCYIGLDSTGTAPLGNDGSGVVVNGSPDNLIGSWVFNFRNVISANETGVILRGAGATGNRVEGNYIGLAASGVAGPPDLGNAFAGIWIDSSASGNVIGVSPEGGTIATNVISDNDAYGILLSGAASGNAVRYNLIGTEVGGVDAAGNGRGVEIRDGASSTRIDMNTIAFNDSHGITVTSTGGEGNFLADNSIHSNGGLGIDLGDDGPTPNDPGDADSGPNGLQNYPVFDSALAGARLWVHGLLESSPGSYTIRYFVNTNCDPSGYGEGGQPSAASFFAPSDSGTITLNLNLEPHLDYRFITATATNRDTGNTSEFSPCQEVLWLGGRALQLDGIDDFVGIPHSAGLTLLNDLTLEAWVRIEDADFDFFPIISKGFDFGNYTLGIAGDQAAVPRVVAYAHQTAGGIHTMRSDNVGTFGEWMHVAVVFSGDAATAAFYVNGVPAGISEDAPPPLVNGDRLLLGRADHTTEPPEYLRGLIDEVRIWDVARTPAEIEGDYIRAVPFETPGLVGYWRADGDTQLVRDSTPHARDGTLGETDTVDVDDPQRVLSTVPLLPPTP